MCVCRCSPLSFISLNKSFTLQSVNASSCSEIHGAVVDNIFKTQFLKLQNTVIKSSCQRKTSEQRRSGYGLEVPREYQFKVVVFSVNWLKMKLRRSLM